jgi:hypothetical protein
MPDRREGVGDARASVQRLCQTGLTRLRTYD